MPFSGGTFTLSDTIANATSADATELQAILDDIQTSLNLTYCRDGQAVATGQFLQVVGATAAYSFSGDTNTGVGSDTGDEVWLMGGGVKTLKANATGVVITGTLAPTGLATFSTLAVTSTSTFSDTITSSASSVGFVGYEAISTEAAAAAGPIVSLYRNSASPAASDVLGAVNFYGKDGAGNKTLYGQVTCAITDTTDGSEDADWYALAMVAGTLTTVIKSSGADIAVPGALAVTGAITGSNIKAMTKQYLTSGSSATYTRPSSPAPSRLVVKMVGGGGGGGASGGTGSTGGTTIFNSINANGGSGGATGTTFGATGGAGGTGGSGSASLRLGGGGGSGGMAISGSASQVGSGGNSAFGGGAQASNGAAGSTNTGGGGAGAASGSVVAGGGGAGEYVEIVISSPSATYTYTVGAGGAGASGGATGGAGGSGLIIVEEYY